MPQARQIPVIIRIESGSGVIKAGSKRLDYLRKYKVSFHYCNELLAASEVLIVSGN